MPYYRTVIGVRSRLVRDAPLSRVGKAALEAGLTGFEFAAGIPWYGGRSRRDECGRLRFPSRKEIWNPVPGYDHGRRGKRYSLPELSWATGPAAFLLLYDIVLEAWSLKARRQDKSGKALYG